MNVTVGEQLQPGQAPVVVLNPTINFTTASWNTTQEVQIIPGDDAVVRGPLPFQLIMDVSSSVDPTFHRRRIIHGLRSDEEAPTGLSPVDPVIVRGTDPGGIQYSSAGVLLGIDPGSQAAAAVKGGDQLDALAGPFGSTSFYNVTPGQTVTLNMAACSVDAPLQVIVYNNSIATWYVDVRQNGAVGFLLALFHDITSQRVMRTPFQGVAFPNIS